MPFDFKKEYKEFYLPPSKPVLVTVPMANYIAVRGKGDPNEEGGAYQQAIGILYAVAYTLKMSYKTDHRIEGFYDYVVPRGRRALTASITATNRPSAGFPSSVFRTSSPRPISIGRSRPHPKRKRLIVPRRSS